MHGHWYMYLIFIKIRVNFVSKAGQDSIKFNIIYVTDSCHLRTPNE